MGCGGWVGIGSSQSSGRVLWWGEDRDVCLVRDKSHVCRTTGNKRLTGGAVKENTPCKPAFI